MRNKFSLRRLSTAGVGMFLGLIIFTMGRKHMLHANVLKPTQEGDTTIGSILIKVFVPAIIAGTIG